MARVTATTPPIPVRRVVATSEAETIRMRNAETPRSGTWSACDTTVTIETTTVMRTIRDQRDGETASSSRRNCQNVERRGARSRPASPIHSAGAAGSVADMMDDRDRRRSDPHQLLGRALQGDAHGEALGDADPVEIALDRRHARDAQVLDLCDGRPDALDASFEMDLGRGHHVGGDRVAGVDALQLRLPEVGDHVPLRGVDEREQGADRGDDL